MIDHELFAHNCAFEINSGIGKILNLDETGIELRKYSDDACIKVISVNIRSCRKNFDELLTMLNVLKNIFAIVILTEIWLTTETDFGFSLNGFDSFNLYRNTYGGGIKVFVNSNYEAVVLNDFTGIGECYESLFLDIKHGEYNFVLGTVYRPPSISITSFTTAFFPKIVSLMESHKNINVFGDFNINLFNPLKLGSIDDFFNEFISYSFVPLILKSTRDTPENPITKHSLLDHIWSNNNDILSSFVLDYQLTDHKPTVALINKN